MSAVTVVTKPANQHTEDVELVGAVRAGDDRAFEQLFLRYQSRIAAYVRGMVRDYERAEDITQEVFIAALRRMRATDAPIAFKPWLYEIAKNACIDAYRRGRHTNEVSFEDDDALGPSLMAGGGAPDAVVDAKLAIDNLCGAFGGLSQAHHDILVMREFEDLSYREIGERLGMSHAAVESTLFRARRRLSEEYDEFVSGERCLRVRAILDASPGRAPGVRDRRRMARHVAHCQPCRRHAHLAGVDLDVVRPPAAARIAALLPLPAFVRRRFDLEAAGQVLGCNGGWAAQWSKVVTVLDPVTVSGWPRAIAAAAAVAVAGLGAGAAVGERPFNILPPAGGAGIAPALGPPTALERAQNRPASEPSGSPAAAPGRDARQTGDSPAGDRARSSAEPDPAAASRPEPTSRPDSAPAASGDLGNGLTSPSSGLPSVDATVGDTPTTLPSLDRPAGGLVGGVGTATDGGIAASAPDPLADALSTTGDPLEQGGAQDAAVPVSPPATGSESATAGSVANPVGQVLDGAGSGQR